ncbi:MAG: LysR family transcriptional regulator [Clostridia bacterium]|nr:LysR family transcriptional regulator [Clostridia bacterium]
MDLKDISYILAVFNHKSISQAAQSLYISQPALSQQIHKIELQLGKPLFTRSGHTMLPTAACRLIAEQGRKLLTERDMLMHAVHHLQETPEETLRFGMSPFYARHLLPGILKHFQQNHPQYTLNFLDRGTSRTLEQDVIDDKLDCCLVPMYPAHPDLDYLLIGKETIYLAVPREHPLNQLVAPDGTIDITKTRDELFILHRDRDKVSELQNKLFAYAGFTPRAIHSTSGWDVVISFVRSGMCLGTITELIIGDYPAEDMPCYYPIQNIDMSRHFAFAYRRGSVLTPAMEQLLEISKIEFARTKARTHIK